MEVAGRPSCQHNTERYLTHFDIFFFQFEMLFSPVCIRDPITVFYCDRSQLNLIRDAHQRQTWK